MPVLDAASMRCPSRARYSGNVDGLLVAEFRYRFGERAGAGISDNRLQGRSNSDFGFQPSPRARAGFPDGACKTSCQLIIHAAKFSSSKTTLRCAKPSQSCSKLQVFPVSTLETNCGSSRREDFWFIVAARSEDETEIRAG